MTHEAWLDELIGDDSRREAGQKSGIDHTTISKQLKGKGLDPMIVVALCRAYGRHPVDGLVETGFLDSADILDAGIPHALAHATNQQLLDEIMKRVDPKGKRLFHSGITPQSMSSDESEIDPLDGLGRVFGDDQIENGDEGGKKTS